MPTPQQSERIPSRAELLARAEALVPVLRARADECERLRRCPDETVADYHAAGLLKICQPARYGGYELGWDIRSEVGEVLARGCGSQAWVHHILTDHSQKLGAFELAAQDDVWGKDPDARIAAGLDPVGRARRVKGGVIYSGRHGFSSGIDHVQWLICGGHILEDGKPPQRCFFVLPKSDATVIDDWYAMGLAGTGSKSFEIKDIFIPEHRILDAVAADDGTAPGTRVHAAPIFKVPFTTIAATGFAAIAVGIARGFLGDWVAYTSARKSRGTAVAELMGTQMLAGAAAARIEAARRIYLGAAEEAMATLARGDRLSWEQRLASRLASGHACQLALEAVQRLFNAAGGRALYSSNVLQRQLRDVQAASSHVSVVWDNVTSGYGRHLLGLEP
jgi:alkylation response protein AidB-like acyl-CoA dehydrogenase